MKLRFLLLLGALPLAAGLQAQKSKKSKTKNTTGFAITAAEMGGRGWKEVRMVDLQSGEVLKQAFDSKQEIEPRNARTGKTISKAEPAGETRVMTTSSPARKIVNLDQELSTRKDKVKVVYIRRSAPVSKTEPFATNSAACAYDKKHERLYYTPMGINQLRYLDLKTGTPYFFENEDFGKVQGMHDAANQITRMVIASDGNGYALTNDARNLIRFTTGKKPVITELGSLADDPKNLRTVHHNGNYGGDMIADAAGNLYLVTAYRHVYRISIKSLTAEYLGSIQGLPRGFSTNGAMVEEDSKVIIASSESTLGYYRFDLNTLQAEKISTADKVFNASDLANANLAFAKKKKEKNEEPTQAVAKEEKEQSPAVESTTQASKPGIAIYPNPVTNGIIRISFADQPAGRYRVQLLDISGRLVGSKEVNINGPAQIEEFRFPELSVKGNYLLQVTNEVNQVRVAEKILVH